MKNKKEWNNTQELENTRMKNVNQFFYDFS